jgi:hypothetical protein
MNQIAKPASQVGAVLHPAELAAQALLDTLAEHKDKALVFIMMAATSDRATILPK